MFGFGKKPPLAKMGFGPNHIKVEVRRAKRDPITRLAIRDENGNIVYEEDLEIYENHNVTCINGFLNAKDRLFNPATTAPIADYIALSESAVAPSSAHTIMAGLTTAEITLSGLAKAVAAYSVAGCSSYECILSKTFTATQSIAAVQLMGLFDATGANTGNLYFEATFTPVALESDDQLTAKWDKITLS